MRHFLLSAALLISTSSFSQTAADFTATDCSSTSHTLFTELNSGKVVVLVWVMPCTNCISDAKGAYDAAQSFASSNPGKVLYWLSDDQGNTACSSLSSWASSYGIGSAAVLFGNAGNAIDEANYGGSGMPHVVVIGADHHVYYNVTNGTGNMATVQTAITQALTATGINETTKDKEAFRLYPNPAKDAVNVGLKLSRASDVTIRIMNIQGSVVKTVSLPKQTSGDHSFRVELDKNLTAGNYFLELNAADLNKKALFTISR